MFPSSQTTVVITSSGAALKLRHSLFRLVCRRSCDLQEAQTSFQTKERDSARRETKRAAVKVRFYSTV